MVLKISLKKNIPNNLFLQRSYTFGPKHFGPCHDLSCHYDWFPFWWNIIKCFIELNSSDYTCNSWLYQGLLKYCVWNNSNFFSMIFSKQNNITCKMVLCKKKKKKKILKMCWVIQVKYFDNYLFKQKTVLQLYLTFSLQRYKFELYSNKFFLQHSYTF